MGIVFLIRHRIARARCILAQSAKAQGEAKAQARARLVAFASACARRRRTDPVDKSACGPNQFAPDRARNKPNSLPLARAKQTQCISAPRGIKPDSLQFARAEQTQFAHSPCAEQTQFASVRARGTNPICFISRARSKPNLLHFRARIKPNRSHRKSSAIFKNLQEYSGIFSASEQGKNETKPLRRVVHRAGRVARS
jgi:hypothetical protein